MARPKTDTVDYYPKLIGNSRLMKTMRRKWGNDAMIYWDLMDELAGKEGHVLDLNRHGDVDDYAAEWFVSPEFLIELLDYLADRERICPVLWKDKKVWCQKFVDSISDVYTKTRRRDVPQKPGVNPELMPVNPELTPEKPGRMPQSKVKDSKEEESIEKELSKFQKQFAEIWKAYGHEDSSRGQSEANLKNAYEMGVKFDTILKNAIQARLYAVLCNQAPKYRWHLQRWLSHAEQGYEKDYTKLIEEHKQAQSEKQTPNRVKNPVMTEAENIVQNLDL